jgi:hypothetical protein
MENTLAAHADQQYEEEDSPLVRAAYAVGVGLLLVGSVLPHSERWTMCGIALIAVSWLY